MQNRIRPSLFIPSLCAFPPRASFIYRLRGKNNLLPVLMAPPPVPVWIGVRGQQSQAIRSKWSLCNTRQMARTKPRPLSVCVCFYNTPLLHSTFASVTRLIPVYFSLFDLPLSKNKPHIHFFFFPALRRHISDPFISVVRGLTLLILCRSPQANPARFLLSYRLRNAEIHDS